MKHIRSEDEMVAAVNASMIMAGQPLSEETETEVRLIIRGEKTADESVLEWLEKHGYGNSERAHYLRHRIAGAA